MGKRSRPVRLTLAAGLLVVLRFVRSPRPTSATKPMADRTQPWHRGTHQARARKVVNAAKADPSTACWRCGRTLAAHPPHKNGRRAFWTGGHVYDGQPDSPYLPEASTCNFQHGARKRAAQMRGKPLTRRRRTNRTNRTPILRTSREW